MEVGIVEQAEPCPLLTLVRRGQVADGDRVDPFAAVKGADARHLVESRGSRLGMNRGDRHRLPARSRAGELERSERRR